MNRAAEVATRLEREIGRVVIGQRDVVREILIAFLSGGHCLLRGVPGLAKTLLIRKLAEAVDLTFSRIQFTPDLMPSDILGAEIIEEDRASGQRAIRFVPGPVFANIVLADEINRTPPKTQAAALDAWRFRAEPAFARFWSTLVVETAARLREQRAIRVEPSVVRPLERLRASGTVRLKADSAVTLELVAPDGEVTLVTGIPLDASTWEATFRAPPIEGVYRIRQTGETGTLPAAFEVAADATAAVDHDETALRLLAAARGGSYVRHAELGALAASLSGSLRRTSTQSVLHPMRWRGWAAIVAIILGTEWWLRRRRGLR